MDILVESELSDGMAASGCPICLVGDKAVRRYQRFTLDASVNALAFRSQLTAA